MNEDTYEGDLTNPLTLNLYTYVENNPLIYTDPTGMCSYKSFGDFGDCFKQAGKLVVKETKKNVKQAVTAAKVVWFVANEAALAYPPAAGAEFMIVKGVKYAWTGAKWVKAAVLGSKGARNIIDDAASIVSDIININKKYSNGNQAYNSIESIVNSASYYDNGYDQIASVTRSITQHAFENGNKRTALDTLNMLLKDFNLKSPLTDVQRSNLINDIAEGRITDVSEISRILQGK